MRPLIVQENGVGQAGLLVGGGIRFGSVIPACGYHIDDGVFDFLTTLEGGFDVLYTYLRVVLHLNLVFDLREQVEVSQPFSEVVFAQIAVQVYEEAFAQRVVAGECTILQPRL